MKNKSICKHDAKEELYGAYRLFFGTLVSEDRLKIINSLRKSPKNVGELVESLGIEQTRVSHNLKRLRHCGFVNVKQEGKYRSYSINADTIGPIMSTIDKHMGKFCINIVRERK